MEHGFFHPDRGYWQTNSGIPAQILATYPEGTIEVPLKPGPDYEWQGEWVYVEPDPAAALAAERASMVCSPAQMRLALLAAGQLEAVQAIADANPQAAIMWEYATQINRTNLLIDALGAENGFSAEQIDDLFRAAMAIEI